MKYVCDYCQKPFVLPDPLTLDDMREHRIITHDGKLWHVTCARTVKEADGSIRVVEPYTGQLARRDGIAAGR